MQRITKLCADHLRNYTQDNFGIKLKAAHAHELVAAYFGYQSRAALLADKLYPISNLIQANVFVLAPTGPINQRRKSLRELPIDLPDTYALSEGIYGGLIADSLLRGTIWPTFEALAISLADDYIRQQGQEHVYRQAIREGVKFNEQNDAVHMTVFRFYQLPLAQGGVQEVNVTSTILLPRVAGYVGFAFPSVSVNVENLGIRH